LLDPKAAAKMLQLRGKPTENYRGCSKWKEAKAAISKQVPKQRTRTSRAAIQPAAKKVVTPQPSTEQESLGSVWNHVA
jgi:hypothetical protein